MTAILKQSLATLAVWAIAGERIASRIEKRVADARLHKINERPTMKMAGLSQIAQFYLLR